LDIHNNEFVVLALHIPCLEKAKMMLKSMALRAFAWFTWRHIQWLLVQCLSDAGLADALHRASVELSTGPFCMKTWDSVTIAEAIKELRK
jgi:hypothetical protein